MNMKISQERSLSEIIGKMSDQELRELVIRIQAKLTQGQLTEIIQVNQKDISRWENGDRTPSVLSLKKM